MILASTSITHPFTPGWQADLHPAPVYHLRAGSVIEREMLEAELAGKHRAGRVWPHERRAVFAEALTAFGGDDAPELIELADREQAAMFGQAESALTASEQAMLDQARRVVAEHWPDYAELEAQVARRDALLPVVAFVRFCTGWDNVDGAEFASVAGQVTDTALRGVPHLALRAAGIFAYQLLYAGASAEKNLPPPSASNASRANSRSGGRSRAGGKSANGTGRKTPR